VYFDFDSSEIRPEFVPVIAAHARAIAANASISCQARRSYRRARLAGVQHRPGRTPRAECAARLLLQGVAESQVVTVSYGEERPAVTGQTEEAGRAAPAAVLPARRGAWNVDQALVA